MTSPSFIVVGLGELTWDLLPSGRQLGGAPTNVAYVSRLLGNHSAVASRVGDDARGREAIERLSDAGIETSFIQRDTAHPTGTVGVSLDATGEPIFTVNQDSAWDYLEWTADWELLARRTDAVCFGTMAQRCEVSCETITRFLAHTRDDAIRLFDVNLRHSFFTAEMLVQSLRSTTVAKLNRDECIQVADMLGAESASEVALARHLIRGFGVRLVAITRGPAGSVMVTEDGTVDHPGHYARVTDTIGAGDAFSAGLVHACLRGATIEKTSEVANRLGAWLVTQCGATPPPDQHLLESISRTLR